MNQQYILNKVKNFKIVTFDLFDTLVTRVVRKASDIWRLADLQIAKKFKIEEGLFYKLRCKAGIAMHIKYRKSETTLHDIYEEIDRLFKKSNLFFSKSQIKWMLNCEVNTDIQYLIPREEMRELFYKILKCNKKIYIISDMYYEKKHLYKILSKNGYSNYSDVIVSSEIGFKKQNGKLWNLFFKKIKSPTIHIGDNWNADAWQLKKIHKHFIKIPSPQKNFKKSHFYTANSSLSNSILHGLIYNKCLFNSPFKESSNPVDTSFEYGYSILGPLFFVFFHWLDHETKDINRFLFLSREGYILKQIYNEYSKHFSFTKKSVYLLTSRRAAGLASIKNFDDIKQYIKLWGYKGTIYDFFIKRFGFKIDNKYNAKIIHPLNVNRTIKVAKIYENDILKICKENRITYLKYLKKQITKKSAVIDLGYRCSTQYYLCKLCSLKIPGYYLLTVLPYLTRRNGIPTYGCYNKLFKINSFKTNLMMKWYHQSIVIHCIETVLMAPHGQFFGFDKKMKPIYNSNKPSTKKWESILNIVFGIKKFLCDFAFFSKRINSYSWKQICKLAYQNLLSFNSKVKRTISNELSTVFVEENDLCGVNEKKWFNKIKNKG